MARQYTIFQKPNIKEKKKKKPFLPVHASQALICSSSSININISNQKTPPTSPRPRSTCSHLEQARASTLNSLHLGLAVHRPPEPLGQLVAVPELAILRLHAAELSGRAAADSAVS